RRPVPPPRWQWETRQVPGSRCRTAAQSGRSRAGHTLLSGGCPPAGHCPWPETWAQAVWETTGPAAPDPWPRRQSACWPSRRRVKRSRNKNQAFSASCPPREETLPGKSVNFIHKVLICLLAERGTPPVKDYNVIIDEF